MYLSSWARCRTSHRLDTTLAAARFLESPASRQSPESLTPPQWVTSRACEQQVRLWLRDLTGQSWQELTSGPLGLCCYNWPTPLSGLSWPRVLPLSYPVPEWNHSVNRLIQPQPATGRAELLSWCACVCVCVFQIVSLYMYGSESMCTRVYWNGDWKDKWHCLSGLLQNVLIDLKKSGKEWGVLCNKGHSPHSQLQMVL